VRVPIGRLLVGLPLTTIALTPALATHLMSRSGPEHPFMVEAPSGTEISGDILVRNDGDNSMELVKLRMDVLSPAGVLVQRRELNRNGISPSILTVPDRKVDKASSLLVYNPFPEFDRSLPIGRLHYELTFKAIDGEEQETTSVDVVPVKPPPSNYVLPVTGRYFVWDGYDFYSHHRRWNYLHPLLAKIGYTGNAGRYAFDFIAVDTAGNRSRGDEAVNENWLSFGQRVRATANGLVVAMHSDAKDDHAYQWGGPNKDPNGVFGNYIVLRHADGTFSIFGHLMHNSPTVRVGDHVKAGQWIARIGASGDAPFPHLHFQRTLSPDDLGEGAPVTWRRVKRAVGEKLEPLPFGYINSGDVIDGN
jgi:Peptidase family M23